MEFHDIANIFPLLEGEEFEKLVDDVKRHGLNEPVWIYEEKILDGRNRYRACEEAGVDVRYRQYDGDNPIQFSISQNLMRRHLTHDQRAMLALPIKRELEKEAKKQQGTRTDLFPESEKSIASVNSNVQAATMVGVGKNAVVEADKLQKDHPELAGKVVAGALTIPEAKRVVWKAEVKQRNENLAINGVALPTGKYCCIVVDPPWPIKHVPRVVRPDLMGDEYTKMTIDEIQDFPLPDFSADDCHLYVWVTHTFLPDAFAIVKSWGFKYECLLTWVKNVGFTPYSFMRSTEHVLFCKKGDLPMMALGRRVDFYGDVREHSRKPEAFYALVRDVSPGPRIDVFGREERDGFDAWGAESGKFDEML